MKTKKSRPDRIDVKKLLPLGKSFLLIDKMLEYRENTEIITEKRITGREWFIRGHFPGNPIMPGHMIAEAMAQTCALFFKKASGGKQDRIFYLAETKIRFFRIVRPGDRMVIKGRPERIFSMAGIFTAEAYVKNRLVAKAQFKMAAKA